MAGGEEDLQPVGLDTDQRTPAAGRSAKGAQPATGECSANVARHQSISAITSGAAQRVGGGDVAHGEHVAMAGHPQFRRDADVPVFVEEFGRQPVGVGSHPPDRPEHGFGDGRALPGAPPNRVAGDLLAGEAVGDHGPMPGVQADPQPIHSGTDTPPDARVIFAQRALTGEVQVDLFARPGGGQVDGAAHRRRSTADDDHRFRGTESFVVGVEPGADLAGRLQRGVAPEPVADSGRNHQGVIGFGDRGALALPGQHDAAGQIEASQLGLHRSHPVQATEPVERNPVVAGPVVGSGEADAEFLTADQPGFHRDADDIRVRGQPNRGQQTHVTESRDDDALAAHGHEGSRRGGHGTKRGTRSMICW